MRFDNLRAPTVPRIAAAALRFAISLEDGSAFLPVTKEATWEDTVRTELIRLETARQSAERMGEPADVFVAKIASLRQLLERKS
jgi:hypothetical protein